MASIHIQDNKTGTTYRVRWRDDGRLCSLSFADLFSAENFKHLVEEHGTQGALRVLEFEERQPA